MKTKSQEKSSKGKTPLASKPASTDLAHNAKRRKQYACDPAYREKAKLAFKLYRAKKLAQGFTLYKPSPTKGRFFRKHNGKTVEVFKLQRVAEQIGKTGQIIKKWEKLGLIPACSFPGTHRVYTAHQATLLLGFAKLVTEYTRRPAMLRMKKQEYKILAHEQWNL